MRTEEEVNARLQKLRGSLKKMETGIKAYARDTGANRTTLGINTRRKLEGEIAGLEWILNAGTEDKALDKLMDQLGLK